jgi:hypothetical protein
MRFVDMVWRWMKAEQIGQHALFCVLFAARVLLDQEKHIFRRCEPVSLGTLPPLQSRDANAGTKRRVEVELENYAMV